MVKPPSSLGGLKSIVTESVTPSYKVVGASGLEGIVAVMIENSEE
jgi:hypothetical protein